MTKKLPTKLLKNVHEQNKLTIEPPKTQSKCTKKEPLNKALNLNGGNDEARTRDLMRDRHAL